MFPVRKREFGRKIFSTGNKILNLVGVLRFSESTDFDAISPENRKSANMGRVYVYVILEHLYLSVEGGTEWETTRTTEIMVEKHWRIRVAILPPYFLKKAELALELTRI